MKLNTSTESYNILMKTMWFGYFYMFIPLLCTLCKGAPLALKTNTIEMYVRELPAAA